MHEKLRHGGWVLLGLVDDVKKKYHPLGGDFVLTATETSKCYKMIVLNENCFKKKFATELVFVGLFG